MCHTLSGFRDSHPGRAVGLSSANDAVRVRPARPADVPALAALERECFDGDRLTPRQLAFHAASRSNAAFLVAERGGDVVGNVLVFFRRGSRRARLYSIAVGRAARGLGVGAKLLVAAERAARKGGAQEFVLEVREDNPVAIALYESRGYRRFGRKPAYYYDGCDALRFAKRLPMAQ